MSSARSARRRQKKVSTSSPNREQVQQLLALIAAASPQDLAAVLAISIPSTEYLAALGAAWRAARRARLFAAAESASAAAFAATPPLVDPTEQQRCADLLAHAAIAVALGSALEARYTELLLAPAQALRQATTRARAESA